MQRRPNANGFLTQDTKGPAIPRIPLGRAIAVADLIIERLRSSAGVAWAETAGSLRRAEETVGDIQIVTATDMPAALIEAIERFPNVDRLLHQDAQHVSVLINRTEVGIRFQDPGNAGSTLLHLTGSHAHFQALQVRAVERGWRLTAEGLHAGDGRLSPAASEDAIYAALALPYIPPEIRNGDDEIAVAARGGLPRLIGRGDIRGDLHMHSTWSDGQDSIEAMVTTCRELGYEYIAITDHSAGSGLSRALTEEGVRRQADEIAALRERFPDIAILHGCEVDIMPDGTLDLPDRVLATFDIVLASLHQRDGQSPDRLLARYVGAMQHPLVTLITHPTNRTIPHRLGYDLDYDRLFEAAVDTGTFLEIDGAPGHLDMNGAMSRQAISAGVSVVVDSDCHRADLLARQMDLGVATARRGWVEPRHVLNTRPLADVRAAIARKRGG
jgi:DNA polymerase (family 10)